MILSAVIRRQTTELVLTNRRIITTLRGIARPLELRKKLGGIAEVVAPKE